MHLKKNFPLSGNGSGNFFALTGTESVQGILTARTESVRLKTACRKRIS